MNELKKIWEKHAKIIMAANITGSKVSPKAFVRNSELQDKRILIAEDESFIRGIMADILTKNGAKVTTVGDASKALWLINEANARGEPFEMLITDLTMQRPMDGLDLFEEFRKSNSQAHAIIMSGYMSEDQRFSSRLNDRRTATLLKPFSYNELLKVIIRQFNNEAMTSVDALAAGKAERGFGKILANNLRVMGKQENDLMALTGDDWSALKDLFLHDARKEFGEGLINQDTYQVFNTLFNLQEMSHYGHMLGHLEFKDLVFMAQYLHSIALNYQEYGLRLGLLGKVVTLQEMLNKTVFTYSLYLGILERAGFAGPSWDSVVADEATKELLSRNQINVVVKNGLRWKDRSKIKSIIEKYGLKPEEIYKTLSLKRLDDAHLTVESINDEFISKFAEQFELILFMDIQGLLAAGSHLYSNEGIKYEKILGRGADGMAVLASNILGHKKVIKINMIYSNEKEARKYNQSLQERRIKFQGQAILAKTEKNVLLAQDVWDGKRHFYVIEINEFVEGKNLSDLVSQSEDGKDKIKYANDYVRLNSQIYALGYVNRDIISLDNVIVNPQGRMRLVDLKRVLVFDKFERFEIKNQLILTLIRMLVKQSFADLKADKFDIIKDLLLRDYSKDQKNIDAALELLLFLLKAYHNTTMDYGDFLKAWNQEIAPIVAKLDRAQMARPLNKIVLSKQFIPLCDFMHAFASGQWIGFVEFAKSPFKKDIKFYFQMIAPDGKPLGAREVLDQISLLENAGYFNRQNSIRITMDTQGLTPRLAEAVLNYVVESFETYEEEGGAYHKKPSFDMLRTMMGLRADYLKILWKNLQSDLQEVGAVQTVRDAALRYEEFWETFYPIDREKHVVIPPLKIVDTSPAQVALPDRAALSKGGIDLNPAQMSMQIKNGPQEFKFNVNGISIDAAQVTGASFSIESMEPVKDLPAILGLR